MSRVESRIKRYSRIIWTVRTDNMTLLFSGIVFDITGPNAVVVNIALHSLESEEGVSGEVMYEQIRSLHYSNGQGIVRLADAKSIDDLRYKK